MKGLAAAVISGGENPFAAAIVDALKAAGADVVAPSSAAAGIDSLVIVAAPPARGPSFLTVTDAELSSALEGFLDVFDALRENVPHLNPNGAVVVVSDRGHLGGWRGAHEMAFAGALAGLMRSVALENLPRGVRANLIAVELPDATTPSDPAAVASLAAFLASAAACAVTGELILANRGRSLQMREARNQTALEAKPS